MAFCVRIALLFFPIWLTGCVDESSIDKESLPTITIQDGSAEEGESLSFIVQLSKVAQEDVSFSWVIVGGGEATQGSDFTGTTGSGIISAGSLSTSVAISSIEDGDDEIHETFIIRIFDLSNVTIADDEAIGTILDDDTPTISINDSASAEGGNITFTATLSRTSVKDVTFEWTTTDIDAVAGSDYTPASAVVGSILAGNLTTTINIPTLADNYDDLNNSETFRIRIGNVSNATIVDDEGIGTIGDSDAPQISINDIVVSEGDVAQFTVSTDIASEQIVSVNWTTSDGTGTAPDDYIAASGTAFIPANSTSTVVNVNTSENLVYETSHNFFVNLSVPVNGTILDNQGNATISDDDSPPTLSINDLTLVEGSLFSFTVSLTGSTEINTTFDWATSDGSGVAGSDYTTASNTGVTILAGNTTATINVTSLNDAIDEPDQDFVVTLSNPANATLADSTGLGTMTDNDASPNMTIDDQAVTEGGVATFTVTLDAVSEANIGFDITTADNTAAAPGDYTTNSASLTINAGLTTQTFNVNVLDDAVPCELGENFFVNLSNAPLAVITDAQGVGTITDNDPSLSINDIIVNEADGTASFTVTPSVVCPGQNIDFDWTTVNGTATSPTDFTASSGTATVLAGNPNVSLVVPLTNDAIAEVTENFTINLSNPINAVILDGTGLANINDADTEPDISIDDVIVTEGTNAVFTVSLSAAAGSNTTVDYTTVVGSATSPGDYTLTAGTATILAGNLNTTITVPTIDDTTDELAAENFTVSLSNANLGTIIDNIGAGTINDNDALPDISINDNAGVEGGNVTLTVSLSHPSYQNITFDWVTSNGTAVAPTHYASNSGTGTTITAGATTALLNIATTTDTIDELDKNFTVTLSNPANGVIIDNTGIGTISDDDPPPTLSIDSVATTEGGALAYTVSLNTISELNVTFDWASSDNVAVAPGDYTAASATGVTILAGNTTSPINITTIDDANYEANEVLDVTLSNPGNATIATGTGVGTINENETPPTVSVNDVIVTESGLLNFTATLSFVADVAISVDYTTGDGTALAPSDYVATTNTLVIPAGNGSGGINITTTDDNLTESQENLTITLSNPINVTIADGTGIGSISDNDAIILTSTLTGGEDVQQALVLPDSSKVIYLADEDTDGDNELYSVNIDGTALTKLNGALPAGGDVTDFAFSADSSKVVFIADGTTNDEFEIWSVNTNGTSLTNLTGGLVSGGDVQDFAISANSARVVFLADKTLDDRFELYSVAITGGAVTTLNTAPVAGGDITDFSISPNSSKVVFLGDRDVDQEFELYSADLAGGSEAQINGALVAGGDVTSFKISNDSSKVVYIADENVDEDFELFSDDLTGGSSVNLNGALVASGDIINFDISADSSKVVYIGDEDTDEDYEIYSVNLGGGAQATLNGALVAFGDVTDFEISADSSLVAYLADENTDGVNELFSSSIAGGGSTQLNGVIGGGQNVTAFGFSNNSTKVVYISDESSLTDFELRSVNTNGTGNTNISGVMVAGGDVQEFLIAPDSSKVAFLADKETNDTFELYSVAIGGGATTQKSSDLITGGQVEPGFLSTPNSSSLIYRADTLVDNITEILSHSF